MRIAIYTRVSTGRQDTENQGAAAGLRPEAGLDHRSRPCGRDHWFEEREGSTAVQARIRAGVAARV
jgi:DNA invertase Pin-like site-specific DNA recombinase